MPRAQRLMLGLLLALLAACRGDTSTPVASAPLPVPADDIAPPLSPPLVAAARAQVGVVRIYDPAYFSVPYPGGDMPADRGVCTDVVIRALRTQGLDLQQAIHEDMRRTSTSIRGNGD